MADKESFWRELQSLISKFKQDKHHYLSKGYPEAQVRLDFLNPFFEALGWDIENRSHKPPHERDVIVELSPETTLRPDCNFRDNQIFENASAYTCLLFLSKNKSQKFKYAEIRELTKPVGQLSNVFANESFSTEAMKVEYISKKQASPEPWNFHLKARKI